MGHGYSPDTLPGIVYTPNQTQQHFSYVPTPEDYQYMDQALDQAKQAGKGGDSPIGCVLVMPDGEPITTQTTEFRENRLLGHAEMNALEEARARVGRYLGQCTLYTTAEPCTGCSYFIDKGQLGMLVIGATRNDAPEFFRKRNTTLHTVWGESKRVLTVVTGLRRTEAAELLTANAKRH